MRVLFEVNNLCLSSAAISSPVVRASERNPFPSVPASDSQVEEEDSREAVRDIWILDPALEVS